MKRLINSLIFSLLSLSIAAQKVDADSAFIRNNYTKKEVYITMRNSIRCPTQHNRIFFSRDLGRVDRGEKFNAVAHSDIHFLFRIVITNKSRIRIYFLSCN